MYDSVNQSVFITGASTGIGCACARYLDNKGYRVFASVRTQKDFDRLDNTTSKLCQPLLMDITHPEEIHEAVKAVEKTLNSEGLNGLINNAGAMLSGPLEYVNLDDFKQLLDVNITGQLAMIQAFLPMIKKARGRIINLSSISGINPVPMVGPYCASKSATHSRLGNSYCFCAIIYRPFNPYSFALRRIFVPGNDQVLMVLKPASDIRGKSLW